MGEQIVLFVVCALAIGLLVRFLVRTTPIPYTVAVFAVGFCGALALRAFATQYRIPVEAVLESLAAVDPELFLLIFLPVLISQSAFSIDISAFWRAFPQILILGIPVLLIATFLTAMAALLVLPWSWSLPVALLFGALISATDPVAVVALMKDLHASRRLETLVEGESLVNDAVAVALFVALAGLVALDAPLSAAWVGDLTLTFLWLGIGGGLLGAMMAALGFSMLTRATFTPSLGVAFSMVGVYGSYWLAEHVFAVSGIIAVLSYALLIARYAPLRLPWPAVKAIAQFWEVLADQANTVLFLLVGIIIGVSLHGPGIWATLIDILGIYLCLQLVRFLSIGAMYPALRRCGFGLRPNQYLALGWSGVRGAVGLAMALVLVHRNLLPMETGEQILTLTAGVVLLSTLINGLGARPLLNRLGLLGVPHQRAAVYARVGDRMRTEMGSELARLQHSGALEYADWDAVKAVTLKSKHLSETRVRPRKAGSGHGVGAIRRALEVERRHYWWQFQRGLIGAGTVSYLVESVDRAADLGQPLEERDTLKRLHTVPRLLHWLKARPLFEKPTLRWSVARVELQYGVARGFALAQQHLQAEQEELSDDPATRARLKSAFLDNKRQAYRWIHELSAAFPETIRSIETAAAARAVLVAKRQSLEGMSKEGLLDPDDRHVLDNELQVQLSGLRVVAQASFRQLDRVLGAHPLLAVLSVHERALAVKAFNLTVLETGESLPLAEWVSARTICVLRSGLLDVVSGRSQTQNVEEVFGPGISFLVADGSRQRIIAQLPTEVLSFPEPSALGDARLSEIHGKLMPRVGQVLN